MLRAVSYPGQWTLAHRINQTLCCGTGKGKLGSKEVVVLIGSQVL